MDFWSFVTILMPIRNEAAYIRRSLAAVVGQDYPPERMEVLVIDGMSSDRTRDIVLELAENHPDVPVVLFNNPARIASTALNIGLRHARGDIIVRVDGHTTISADYVSQCVATLDRTGADNVGGRMNAVGQNYFGRVVAIATSSPFGVGGSRFHYSDREEWIDTVYMGAWHRKVFTNLGLFDEELIRDQDDELNYRLRAHGGRIFLNPEIYSQYQVRSNPIALWRQYCQYGYWKVRVLQKHPGQMRPRQFVPALFVSSLLTTFLLTGFTAWGINLSVVILAVYLLANLIATLWSVRGGNWRYLPLLPLVFAILHFSYGSGFIWGLIRFAHRWGDKEGKVPSLREVHA